MIKSDSRSILQAAPQALDFFQQRPRLLIVTLAVLFLLAGAVRFRNLTNPGLAIDREYHSAIFARAYYFESSNAIEAWRKESAFQARRYLPILEPSITEFLVSVIYRVAGSEQLPFARLLTSSFWLVGGIFLYNLVQRIVSTDAAVFAVAYYLLVPLGVLTSRSFQPDSLMMLTLLVSLLTMIQYYDQPSASRLAIAALASGLTILHRPLVLFTLIGAFVALAIHKDGALKAFRSTRFWLFIVLSLLPFVFYYGNAVLIAGFLRWRITGMFMPHLFLTGEFWKGWLLAGTAAVGLTPLVAALLGVPLLRRGVPRALWIGSSIGYLIFCLTNNYYIHWADYYHLQLIPLVALPLGELLAFLLNYLKQAETKWYWWTPTLGAAVLVTFSMVLDVRSNLGGPGFESEETAQEIGEIVHHSTHTVFLSRFYGVPLQYYSELAGVYWPRRSTYWLYSRPGERELSVQERLNIIGFTPEYFIITDFEEFNQYHTDLKAYLANNNCPLVAKSDQYLIYGACTK